MKIRQKVILFGITFFCIVFTSSLNAGFKAEEFIYYSMYGGDRSHAVHFNALKDLGNGYIASASRYPIHSDEGDWPKEQLNRAYYEYSETIIDCQTGARLATKNYLLNETSDKIAEKNVLAESVGYLQDHYAEVILNPDKGNVRSLTQLKWPDNSETALACIALSYPNLMQNRIATIEKMQVNEKKELFDRFSDETEQLNTLLEQPLPPIKGKSENNALDMFEKLVGSVERHNSRITHQKHDTNVGAALKKTKVLDEKYVAWINHKLVIQDPSYASNTIVVKGFDANGWVSLTIELPTSYYEPLADLLKHVPQRIDEKANSIQLNSIIHCPTASFFQKDFSLKDESHNVLFRKNIAWNHPINKINEYSSTLLAPDLIRFPQSDSVVDLICSAVKAQCTNEPIRLWNQVPVIDKDLFNVNETIANFEVIRSHLRKYTTLGYQGCV